MFRSIALFLAALLLALLLAEAALRLTGQSYYWAFAKRPDPVLGWRPPPNRAAWQRFEGEALVRTNALGFRDHDHAQDKPPGVLRIAVLGDSFTEAVQVPLEQTWWRRLAAQLNDGACGGTLDETVEVLSFAVSGYSTAQSLLAWRTEAQQFAPDIAILAFFIGNDLNENHPALNQEPMRPYLIPAGDQLMLNDDFLHSAEYRRAISLRGQSGQWLLERSRIAQLVLQAHDALRISRIGSATSHDHAAPQELGVDNALYRPPQSPAWKAAWRTTEAMLAAFAAETRAHAAQPLLMLIGTGAQVHPNAQGRARFAAALGVHDLGYPIRRLLAAAAAERLPVLNLPARWTMPEPPSRALLHGLPGGRPGFGHWNRLGHETAAAAVADRICELWRNPDVP